MKTDKKHDFSGMIDHFNKFTSPKELAGGLVQLLFNYASCVNENNLDCFKDDVDTIHILYEGIVKIK